MNNKINIKRFAEIVASSNDIGLDEATAFVKEFFSTVAEALETDKSIDLDSIGRFEITDNSEDPILFTPCREIADDINAPFVMFTPTPIDEEVDITKLEEDDDTKSGDEVAETTPKAPEQDFSEPSKSELIEPVEPIAEINNDIEVEETATEEIPTTVTAVDKAIEAPAEESINDIRAESETTTSSQGICEIQTAEEPKSYIIEEEEDVLIDYSSAHKSRFGLGFVLGLVVGLMIGALALFGYMVYFISQPPAA